MGQYPIAVWTDEEEFLREYCEEIERVADYFSRVGNFWQVLEDFFFRCLDQRNDEMSEAIVAWANARHPSADRALRRYSKREASHSRFDQMLVGVRDYHIRVASTAPVPYPRGRGALLHMMRDIWIPASLDNIASGIPWLKPTRKTTTDRPSVAFYLAKAMKRMKHRGIRPLSEDRINEIYWRRDHNRLAALIAASMPQILGK
jgi:hypothetical protein